MKRNVFGALIVAGGLVLATSVASFAKTPGDFNAAADAAKLAVSNCAKNPALTDPTGLTGEAATEAAALNAETKTAIAEVTAEATSSIDEAVAESTDEDGAQTTGALSAQLTEIVNGACKAIASLKAEYVAALAELNVGSANVEKQDVEKQDVEKPEKPEVDKEKADKPEKPEVRSTTREGND